MLIQVETSSVLSAVGLVDTIFIDVCLISHTDLSLGNGALASTSSSSYTEPCCMGFFGYHLDLNVALGLIRDVRRVLTELSLRNSRKWKSK